MTPAHSHSCHNLHSKPSSLHIERSIFDFVFFSIDKSLEWCVENGDTTLEWTIAFLTEWNENGEKEIEINTISNKQSRATYLRSSKFKINCVIFMFMSLNVRVSKSFSCDFVIFNQIFSRFWNLFCNESNTWLNESSPSHVTWIVLFRISCGEQEHGDISGLMEQCNEATCTIDTTVYTRDAIFLCSVFPTLSLFLSRSLTMMWWSVRLIFEETKYTDCGRGGINHFPDNFFTIKCHKFNNWIWKNPHLFPR